MSYYVTTRDPLRRATWLRLFGEDHLPVLHQQPRYQEVPGRGSRLAYDLNLAALHPFTRRRLAAYVARRTRCEYGVVWAQVRTAVSWPIDAVDCIVVDLARERPFFIPTHEKIWMTFA